MTKPPVDPKIAAGLAAVFAILGALGVFSKLELGADELAIITGALGTLLTMGRATLLSLAHRKALKAEPAELEEPAGDATPDEILEANGEG